MRTTLSLARYPYIATSSNAILTLTRRQSSSWAGGLIWWDIEISQDMINADLVSNVTWQDWNHTKKAWSCVDGFIYE